MALAGDNIIIYDCIRCVLHAVFAQQSYTSQRPGNKLAMIARKVSWSLPSRAAAKVRPAADKEKKVTVVVAEERERAAQSPPAAQLKRKDTLTPRGPCVGLASTPLTARRATIPTITVVEAAPASL